MVRARRRGLGPGGSEFRRSLAASAANKASREARIAYINKKLAGRPDLIEKMMPPHRHVFAAIMIDTEDSISILMRDNVTLVTDGIERITSKGIVSREMKFPST